MSLEVAGVGRVLCIGEGCAAAGAGQELCPGCLIAACATLQEMAARTGMLVAYRTVQYPQMADCAESGKAMDHQIGYRYQVTYLNAAGREVG